MIDMTMTYVLIFCFAMIVVSRAITACEVRRMSNLRGRCNPQVRPTAPEMTPVRVRVQARRTR